MSESLLIALGDLTNGAINYYQNPRVVMAKRKVIETYIDQLQQEKQQLKEKYEELQEAFKKAITTEHHKIHALLDIIDEVKTAVDYMIGNADISEIHGTKLKQILDKIKEN